MLPIRIYPFLLILIFCISCSGDRKPALSKNNNGSEPEILSGTVKPDERNVHNSYEYADSVGKRVMIQNSVPKGGITYVGADGKQYVYAVFWTRITNETGNQLNLQLNFPLNSYKVPYLPGKYFQVFIPDDTMVADKIPLFNYGLSAVETFLDKNIHKPSSSKRTINPNESKAFYVVMLSLKPGTETGTGALRTGLSVKGQDLFYRLSLFGSISTHPLMNDQDFPCGSINLKNLTLLRSKNTGPTQKV